MCLAMNPDELEGREICASSSNRNFKGRQGSPTGRTLLMSPAMVAAAAVAGEVVDIREIAGMMPIEKIRRDPRARASRYAATTSTPIGSSLRASSSRSPSKGSSSTCSKTIAQQLEADGQRHPIADPEYAGAAICWSTPTSDVAHRASMRRRRSAAAAFSAVVGQSFSEIFFGNSVALGMPCVSVGQRDRRDTDVRG